MLSVGFIYTYEVYSTISCVWCMYVVMIIKFEKKAYEALALAYG